MTSFGASEGAVTLIVSDVPASQEWYSKVFGAPIVFEADDSVVFQFENTLVNLLLASSAEELVAPMPITVGGPARAQYTVWVDDVDAVQAEVVARGVGFINGPLDRDWRQRTACLADPDGHVWEFAQTVPG